MNVLHGEASRADCYEKHTSTDAATHTLLHFNPTRKMIEPDFSYDLENGIGVQIKNEKVVFVGKQYEIL